MEDQKIKAQHAKKDAYRDYLIDAGQYLSRVGDDAVLLDMQGKAKPTKDQKGG